MKYQESDETLLKSNIEYIEVRWEQLSNLTLDLTNNGIKYLFLINSGASVALLAFLGSSEKIRALIWPWYALILFVGGIIFVGIINFARYHLVEHIYKNWRNDVFKYYDNKICFKTITDNDTKRSEKFSFLVLLAYFSFASFLIGVTLIAMNIKTFIKHEQEVTKNKISLIDQKNHIPKYPPPAPIKKK